MAKALMGLEEATQIRIHKIKIMDTNQIINNTKKIWMQTKNQVAIKEINNIKELNKDKISNSRTTKVIKERTKVIKRIIMLEIKIKDKISKIKVLILKIIKIKIKN